MKRRNQPPDNYPQTLRKQPDNVTRTFPIHRKRRREELYLQLIQLGKYSTGMVPYLIFYML